MFCSLDVSLLFFPGPDTRLLTVLKRVTGFRGHLVQSPRVLLQARDDVSGIYHVHHGGTTTDMATALTTVMTMTRGHDRSNCPLPETV